MRTYEDAGGVSGQGFASLADRLFLIEDNDPFLQRGVKS